MRRETIFSPCRRYRYTLWREWGIGSLPLLKLTRPPEQYVQFIGLNPSTADETQDDPTIRRCIAYAKAWGFGAMCMTNLFAWRDTEPRLMMAEPHPVCEPKKANENDRWIIEVGRGAGLVVAAWGKHGTHENRDALLKATLHSAGVELHCLGLNSDGTPKHPLYLAKTLQPVRM